MDIIQERAKAPFDQTAGGSDFGVRLFDSTTTSQAHAIPAAWTGKIVDLYVPVGGAEVHFGFSKNASASIDEAAAASAAGTSANVGGVVAPGQHRRLYVPLAKKGEPMYFVRASLSTTSVRMELSSS